MGISTTVEISIILIFMLLTGKHLDRDEGNLTAQIYPGILILILFFKYS